MKKLSFLLTCMLFGLVACGDTGNSSGSSTEAVEEAPAAAEAVAAPAEEVAEEAAADSGDEAAADDSGDEAAANDAGEG